MLPDLSHLPDLAARVTEARAAHAQATAALHAAIRRKAQDGASLVELGRVLGVSRQRVWQIVRSARR